MASEDFFTKEKLIEHINKQVQALLQANSIYDIDYYGWVPQGVAVKENVGHAMWKMTPPFDTCSSSIINGECTTYRPTKKDKHLTVTGSDFEGLMKASSMSIGLCLLYKDVALHNCYEDNHFFWLHHTSSLILLNMASDRIRDYFIASFFNQTEEEFKKSSRKNGWYVAPFIKAKEELYKTSDSNVTVIVKSLPDIANKIYSFREQRNCIVHEISTKEGKFNKELVEKEQKKYDLKSTSTILNDYKSEKYIKEQNNNINPYEVEIIESSAIIIDWYKILMEFSSDIFESEYWLRINQ